MSTTAKKDQGPGGPRRRGPGTITILGIDPGTAATGWGVIRAGGANLTRISHVGHGAVSTEAGQPPARRLELIFERLSELIGYYGPTAVAIEQLFFNTNVTSAISVGQARGVAILAAQRSAVEVADYTPLEIKAAITSYGRADKRQVQQMVATILKLEQRPTPNHAADALAAAICHAFCASGPRTGRPRKGAASTGARPDASTAPKAGRKGGSAR